MAAGLLAIPGLVTDVVALALLFRPSRKAAKALLRRRLQARLVSMRHARFDSRAGHDEIIDVKVIENPPRQLP